MLLPHELPKRGRSSSRSINENILSSVPEEGESDQALGQLAVAGVGALSVGEWLSLDGDPRPFATPYI